MRKEMKGKKIVSKDFKKFNNLLYTAVVYLMPSPNQLSVVN